MASTLSLNKPLSDEFLIPTNKSIGAKSLDNIDEKCIYLCGHSLGAMSKRSRTIVEEELDVWSKQAVEGHFAHLLKRDWVGYADHLIPYFSELVGSKQVEVACMGTLTANLHLMMDSFYKPTQDRYKILCEARAFPSDQYAFASQAHKHGFDPSIAVLELSPREGEFILREEDILETIDREGSSIALVLLSGVQYYTGQWFPMEKITHAAHEKGCICGWDLAHAVGNVPLSLHDWNVDFAVWCTYKYLNGGPGSIAGLFMHEKWNHIVKPLHAGWWGHNPSTRFNMNSTFIPIIGAQGFQQSNPSILSAASLLGSLQIFRAVGMMPAIRERSLALTGTLEKYLVKSKYFIPPAHSMHTTQTGFTIITPSDPEARGAQLSLLFFPVGAGVMMQVFQMLCSFGVLGDERKPDVIRLAPIALYNTLKDCEQAAFYIDKAFDTIIV